MLHVVMADGGFDVSGKENIQEVSFCERLVNVLHTLCERSVNAQR